MDKNTPDNASGELSYWITRHTEMVNRALDAERRALKAESLSGALELRVQQLKRERSAIESLIADTVAVSDRCAQKELQYDLENILAWYKNWMPVVEQVEALEPHIADTLSLSPLLEAFKAAKANEALSSE